MQTMQILLQIINNISQNPSCISRLPWKDIKFCIQEELRIRHFLYKDSQYVSLQQDMQQSFIQIEEAVALSDSASLIFYLSQIAYALQFLPESEHTLQQYCQANFNQACLEHFRKNTIIVLGDSHVNFFSGNELLSFIPIGNDINTCTATDSSLPFTPLHLGPCLAYNCNRYNTTFRFREKLEYLCENFIKPNATLVCCLGEIDLRVHVFKQSKQQNRTWQEIVDDILKEYFEFLLRMQGQGYLLYVWEPIASQNDDCPIDADFPRNGSEEDRNRATAYFNEQLAAFCTTHNIGFLSVYDRMITPDFKTRTEYLSADHCHLGQKALPLATAEWQKINHPSFRNSPL